MKGAGRGPYRAADRTSRAVRTYSPVAFAMISLATLEGTSA